MSAKSERTARFMAWFVLFLFGTAGLAYLIQ